MAERPRFPALRASPRFGLPLFVVPLLGLLLASSTRAGEPVRLVEIYDADTIRVERADATQVNVRLIGVDAPEVQGRIRDAELGGEAASAFLRRLLSTDRIEIEADLVGDDVDKYDRLLRYVRLPDGRDAGAEILAAGYARAYRRFSYTRKNAYVALEARARQDQEGLWGDLGAGTEKQP